MSQLNVSVDQLPPGAFAYQYGVVDVAGTVASNNYLSLFNPANSTKTVLYLLYVVHKYTTGSSTTATSMIGYRTTAASGGSLVSPANVTKFVTAQPNSVVEVRTGNPSATLLTGSVPLLSASPPLGTGAGNSNPTSQSSTPGALALSLPGEGIVFNVAAGNTNQVWGVFLAWAEF